MGIEELRRGRVRLSGGDQTNLPRSWKESLQAHSTDDERSYAVLLCRAAGLQHAAVPCKKEDLEDLGGADYTKRTAEELERLLALTSGELTAKKEKLALRYTARKQVMQSALGDAATLFESWVFAEAARRLGVSEEWQAMITTSKSGDVKAPDVICSVAPSGLDVECFNIHEHMKSIAPEQGRLHTATGNSSTDSAPIWKGRHPFLGSWWCLAWELARKGLRLTYPGEIRLRDPNIHSYYDV